MARKVQKSGAAGPVSLPGVRPVTQAYPSGQVCAGIDEVGRGCLAGPVVACAVALPGNCVIEGLDDSKKLSPERREALAPVVRAKALSFGIGCVWPGRIDTINILQATFEAMAMAYLRLVRRLGADLLTQKRVPRTLLVDGNKTIPAEVLTRILEPALPGDVLSLPPELQLARLDVRQKCVVKGDHLVPAISAASVLAKVWRDRLMSKLAKVWPGYGFEVHKGYGTAAHYEALRKLGPCPLHRLTFRGVAHETGEYQADGGAKLLTH